MILQSGTVLNAYRSEMSKEVLRILGQIWDEDGQYEDNDNRIAYVAEALESPMGKDGISQGPNFLYADPKAEVGDRHPLHFLSDTLSLDW